ncbi:MAG: VWA domain-containing protein [Sciscionella sp.]
MKCSRTKTAKASAGQASLRRRGQQLFLIFILAIPLFAQQEPTFQTQSNVVLVPTLVRDHSGETVYGLHAEDFVIEDNGAQQVVRLDEAAEAEPLSLMIAIQTGRKAEHEFPEIRGLKDMLDPILAQEASQIAIVTFDSQIQLAQDFTGDASKVDSALEHLQPGDDGAVILNTVNYCVGLLNKQPEARHRVLLLISEKRDYGSKAAILDHVITLIGASNTTIYSLIFSPAHTSALRRLRAQDTEDIGAPPVDIMALLDLARAAMKKNSSKAIAEQTGGEYELFDSRSSFESRMIDFTNHLHSRYLLSFQPNDPQPGLHRITVRLKQPADKGVLARSTYWARGTGG